MEYQKIANLIDDDASSQPSKFRTKNWVETIDESRGAYNVNSQIKFKTTMLKSSLCDYIDAYILVKGKIAITATGDNAAARQADERDKGVAFKNCSPFLTCIIEISNTQIDNCKDIDIVIPMYNLIEYSDNYAKISGSLWQYYRDEPNDNLANSQSFKSKVKITGKTPADGNEKDVEIALLLKYLSNIWQSLEIPTINCEVNLILTWSSTCVNTNSIGAGAFKITDTKLYVSVVTLSTQDNSKLLQQLKSGFKRVINWNEYLSKPELLAQNRNLNHLIEPSFQKINRIFILACEGDTQRTSQTGPCLPNVQLKDYSIMTNDENFFDQPIQNDIVTYEEFRKAWTGCGDDYTTSCLLDYTYFKDTY